MLALSIIALRTKKRPICRLLISNGNLFLFDEVFGGEIDSLVEAVSNVGSTGEFEHGKIMAKGEGDFADEKVGVRGYDGSAK